VADGFTVTSVNQSQRIGAGDRLEDVIVVLFELDDDAGSGEVVVPATGDWHTAAEAAVRQKAGEMLALLSL